MKFPQLSVTRYLLVIVSGQLFPSEVSSSQLTIGGVPLSASSLTTLTSGAGISEEH